MSLSDIDIQQLISQIKEELERDKSLSPSLKGLIQMLLLVVPLMYQKLGLNSRNSSKPPSSDPNREKSKQSDSGQKNKRGGQKGHKGTTLQQTDEPDHIESLPLDRGLLPAGDYKNDTPEKRQVVDIEISVVVTEYQAEVLVNQQNGERFVAPFPKGVNKAVQYGSAVKAHAVYMSQYQLLPYQRIQDYFGQYLNLPLSTGSLFNFNQEAYDALAQFELLSIRQLIRESVVHFDETGINIDKKRQWLHCAASPKWTLFLPHEKRGSDAMNEMAVLPLFKGVAVHDHWKPYYKYDCTHALCHAHHLRELTFAHEEDGQAWAEEMRKLLVHINDTCEQKVADKVQAEAFRDQYRAILKAADKECPAPVRAPEDKKRGRLKKSKSRNLLERLMDYEDDVLRFMEHPEVPFTNNHGENEIRMTKVQQKISGCFRSMEGAKIFCRVRGYLNTCRKNNVTAQEAMTLLFNGELPAFAKDAE